MIYDVMNAVRQVLSKVSDLEAIFIGIPEAPLEEKKHIATICFSESDEEKYVTRGSRISFVVSVMIVSRLSDLNTDYKAHIELLEKCRTELLNDLHSPSSKIRSAMSMKGDYTVLTMSLVKPPEGREGIIIHEIGLRLYYLE